LQLSWEKWEFGFFCFGHAVVEGPATGKDNGKRLWERGKTCVRSIGTTKKGGEKIYIQFISRVRSHVNSRELIFAVILRGKVKLETHQNNRGEKKGPHGNNFKEDWAHAAQKKIFMGEPNPFKPDHQEEGTAKFEELLANRGKGGGIP